VGLLSFGIFSGGFIAHVLFKDQVLSQIEKTLSAQMAHQLRFLEGKPEGVWCQVLKTETHEGFFFQIARASGELVCGKYNDFPVIPSVFSDLFLENQSSHIGYRSDFVVASMPFREGYLLVGATSVSPALLSLSVFDSTLSSWLIAFWILLTGLVIFVSRAFVMPLGRAIQMAQGLIVNREASLTRQAANEEVFGEWSELEQHLEDVRRNLRTASENLFQEKGELDTIMGAISDAIVAVDQQGALLFFNTRFEILFGHRQQSIKPHLWDWFRDPSIVEAFEMGLKQGRPAHTAPIALETHDGLTQHFTLSVSPLRTGGEDVYGALGIFHDVTELKVAEQMRIDFVANVSHELRTPLTSIKGYADTLKVDLESIGSQRTHIDYLGTILRNANRLTYLMDDLLDLSSLESHVLLHKEPIDLEELTQRAAKQVEDAIHGKKQTLKTHLSVKTLYADPLRLEQVLVNLLDNASKYTPEGGTIEVYWGQEENFIVLKVSDSGPGIEKAHQSRLFERFYRVDKARSRELGGTGLGLAIVKHILLKHGGNVVVQSELGKGATFICRFPSIAL